MLKNSSEFCNSSRKQIFHLNRNIREIMVKNLSSLFQKHYHVSRADPDELLKKILFALRELKAIIMFWFGSLGVLGVTLIVYRNELATPYWIAIIGSGLALSIGAMYVIIGLRSRMLLGYFLHDLFHDSRDDLMKLYNAIAKFREISGKTPQNADKTNAAGEAVHRLQDDFGQSIAENTAEYFRRILGEHDVGCSIRILQSDDQFHTWWRSRNLRMRGPTSVPTPSDRGIGYAVRSVNAELGAYIVNDIRSAPEELWLPFPNDDRTDIKNVMVAPINGYDEGEKKCMGLLFVSSRKRKFHSWYAEHLMGISDFVGTILPNITIAGPN